MNLFTENEIETQKLDWDISNRLMFCTSIIHLIISIDCKKVQQCNF